MHPIQALKNRFGSKKGFINYVKYKVLQSLCGKYKENMKIEHTPDRVVFACKGNICRSALAEVVFVQNSSLPCTSFGLDTQTGHPANPVIASAAKALGYSLNTHTTTALSDFELRPNDLIICFEPQHLDAIKSIFKNANILLFGSLGTPSKTYIHDPYSSEAGYINYISKYIIDTTINISRKCEIN